MDYFGARYYDASIGRWLAVDPLASKYPGWTPYNYVKANPLIRIDPDGMEDGNYYDEQGNFIGTDNITDNKTYIVNSSNKSTVANALTSGNTSVAQQNSLLIPQHTTRQDMYKIASQSLTGQTRVEHGGSIYGTQSGGEKVVEGTPGQVVPGGVTECATHIPLNYTDMQGTTGDMRGRFHAHPNIIDPNTGNYAYDQPPSNVLPNGQPGDIPNAAQFGQLLYNNYVYTDKNVYIYNSSGVLATIPTQVFNTIK